MTSKWCHRPKRRAGQELSRQAKYYHRIRDAIFEALGRVCKKCGGTVDLEFDIMQPVGGPKSHHEKLSSCSRAAFYKRQHAARNVQILCSSCDTRKGDQPEPAVENKPLTNVPGDGTLIASTVTNQTV